jgi:DNA helicase-2/ATP-dependent DNA helicase PcrA
VLSDSLNAAQREAVEHVEGPLLILAGAGSGKTRVLTHRIAHLLEQGLAEPEEILAITFTNKASREMKERVSELIGAEAKGMWVSTFHAFCSRILRAQADKLGYKREFTIYDAADQQRLIKRCIIDLNKDPKRFNPRAFQGQISTAKNSLLSADDYLRQTEGYMAENIAEVYDLYQKRLYENNAMDFDDLLMNTVSLFEMFSDVRERYRNKFRYIHVDEYQDTNHAQYKLVNALAGDPSHRRLCVVGDDDQCLVEGTRVTMADRTERAIEEIKPGDEVLSGYGSGEFRGAKVMRVHEHHGAREGVEITTEAGHKLVSTPEHVHFAGYRLGLASQRHFTYLMYREDTGYRLGTTQVYTKGQKKPMVGLSQRLMHEHGDALWVISTHESENEARLEEYVLSLRHQLPTLPFVPRKKNSLDGAGGLVHDGRYLDRVFCAFDTEAGARRLLEERGLSHEHPHYRPRSRDSKRRNVVVTLCGDRRGRTPMHRISMVGNDEAGREALESAELSVRPVKAGSGSWRHETASKSYGDLQGTVGLISGKFDRVNVTCNARLGRVEEGAASSSLPFVQAASVMPGMAMFDADGGYDTVASVERVTLDRPVYDLDVEHTHNYVAEGIVTHNSVYSWRGADISNILDFERDYPEAKVVRLEQNYRSTQTILRAANAVVANNASRKAKELWTEGIEGEKIRVHTAADEYAEARYVVSEIERLVEEGSSRDEVAVFYRTNAQSRALEDVLMRERVPYQILGGQKFYERAEIKDAVSYLSVIANPADSVSLERIVNVPKRGLGDTSVAKLREYAARNGISLYDALDEASEAGVSGKAQKACATVRELFEGWRIAAPEIPPSELIGAVLDDSGYRRELREDNTVESEGRLENLAELLNAAAEYEREEPEPTLDGFLQEQALYSESDKLDDASSLAGGGNVTLMTLHSAKGLEYEHAFIVGMEEGTFPHSRSLDEQNDEEERRLAYVGITRAMKTLTLTYAKLRSSWGGDREYQMPSRFLDEIPDEFRSGPAGGSAGASSRQVSRSRETVGRGGWGSAALSSARGPRAGAASRSSDAGSTAAGDGEFAKGDRVRHSKFGEGEVVSVGGGKVVVRFGSEEKTFVPGLAPLSKV